MRDCLDEGTLQSYFDGELSNEPLKDVTLHLASCQTCTAAVREMEAELNLVSTALAPELEAAVPTAHLRQRIDAAIAEMHTQRALRSESSTFSLRGWLQSLVAPFSIAPQRAFGYAGLVLVLGFAAILGLTQWRNATPEEVAVSSPPSKANPISTVTPQVTPVAPDTQVTPVVATAVTQPPAKQATSRKNQNSRPQPSTLNNQVAKKNVDKSDEVKLLPGERSYLQTIAKLDSTIKSNSNRPMRPALQAEYERNLALVDRALAATRNAAKKNPSDPDAAEFMFAAYQNKVSLLNTVAEARTFNRQQD
jgi:anti-sigma factor RsiW